MKELMKKLKAHSVVLMPLELKKEKARLVAFSIILGLVADTFVIMTRVGTNYINNGQILIGLILFSCYYLSGSIRTFFGFRINQRDIALSRQLDNYLFQNTLKISNVVRGKVLKSEESFETVMGNPTVVDKLKDYIRLVWDFWSGIPSAVAIICSAIIMAIITLSIEFSSGKSFTTIMIFFGCLIVSCTTLVVISKLNIRVKDQYRDFFRKNRNDRAELENDLKNIEPLSDEEFEYHANKFIVAYNEFKICCKEESKSLGKHDILKSVVLSITLIIIMITQVFYVGLSHLTAGTVLEFIALINIFSGIIDKVGSIVNTWETYVNFVKDINIIYPEFHSITSVYDSEKQFSFTTTTLEQILVSPFCAEYSGSASNYRLENKEAFVLEKGKAYLFSGHTGCGKSSLLRILCGKMKLPNSPIQFGTEKGYLCSVMHETNGQLGSGFVLSEIIFSDDYSTLDRTKLLELLKGSTLYYDIAKNLGLSESSEIDTTVIEYLTRTTFKQYSSGQRQRLSAIKLLYNLNESQQIIAFDEVTNALDDNTARKAISFFINYCQRDTKRILLFASHQASIMESLVDGIFTFDEKPPAFIIKQR